MKEKTKIGYKIVSFHKKTRTYESLYVSREDGGRIYKHGRFVKPRKNCGPLGVFEDLDLARQWREGYPIFQVEYVPSETTFFKDAHGCIGYFPSFGTVFADAVKLIKKV